MKTRWLLIWSLAGAVYFWLLELLDVHSISDADSPFAEAMHATALSIVLTVLLRRRRTRKNHALVYAVALSIAMWTLKLFTTEVIYRYEREGGESGVVLRERPALHNTMHLYANAGDPIPSSYISPNRIDCIGPYPGDKLYRWLTSYGYLWSTALSVALLTLWLRDRPRPAPASPRPQPQGTVYRD